MNQYLFVNNNTIILYKPKKDIKHKFIFIKIIQ